MRYSGHIFLIISWIVTLSVKNTDGACTFSKAIQGTWFRSRDSKTLNFTETQVSGVALIASTVPINTLGCEENNGTKYLLKFTFLSQLSKKTVGVYLCFDLRKDKETDNQYHLYELANFANEITSGGKKERGIVDQNQAQTLATTCVNTDATISPSALIRTGDGVELATLCPSVIFGNYNYTVDGTKCTGDSFLGVCPERKMVTVNYTWCPEPILYSKGGLLDCVGYIKKEEITFLTLWNKDASSDIDNVNYFQTTCLVIKKEAETERILMTQYPRQCHINQTATVVPAGGKTFTMVPHTTCPFKDDMLIYIIIGVVCGVVVLVALAVGIYCIVRKCRARRARKVSPQDKSKQEKKADVEKGETAKENGSAKPTSDKANGTVKPTPTSKDSGTTVQAADKTSSAQSEASKPVTQSTGAQTDTSPTPKPDTTSVPKPDATTTKVDTTPAPQPESAPTPKPDAKPIPTTDTQPNAEPTASDRGSSKPDTAPVESQEAKAVSESKPETSETTPATDGEPPVQQPSSNSKPVNALEESATKNS